MQPEVPLTTTTVENLKWFGQELTSYELTNQTIERIIINHAIDPKGQRDLQCHIIFYMTTKCHGLPRPLWPNCGSIQRQLRQIFAIECIMTSCLWDRKWHRKVIITKQKSSSFCFKQSKFDINLTVKNGDIPIQIYWWRTTQVTESSFFDQHSWKIQVIFSRINRILMDNSYYKEMYACTFQVLHDIAQYWHVNWNMVITFERLVRFKKSFRLRDERTFCHLLQNTLFQYDRY